MHCSCAKDHFNNILEILLPQPPDTWNRQVDMPHETHFPRFLLSPISSAIILTKGATIPRISTTATAVSWTTVAGS
ncbi:hypothetical protein TNCT_654771 [Trichonephila clavata]|uniref:Uncharacterized protein n=1 Tax=Trichonephila clavata TaxID=2740835 RepID=A0A8X6FC38_TRICU|nr:hypothetical protein TNCT_654771 [Trichonephila clavata]